ncbi:MAG: two-component sensor histidine kinase [Bacteroidetes bacterium]|nr:two-component sensor histidine kinase [Bacteroidota bacterium]
MKSGITIPLFWKFAIAIVCTVSIFGIINLYFTNYAVYDLYENELKRHGNTTAISIAERSINPIIYNDVVSLNNIVSSQKDIDSTYAYIFITNKTGDILAHSFDHIVPVELKNLRSYSSKIDLATQKITDKNNQETIIWDIIAPILDGEYGYVRVGLYERNFSSSIKKTSEIFILMIGMFVILGIIGALFFASIITKPIKIISSISKNIELGTLDVQKDDVELTLLNTELVKWKNFLNINDEIDVLITSFGEMVSRLKNTYDELKKTEKSLLHSEKMASLGTLSAGLAHEINNPIAGVKNCIRRLKETPDNVSQNNSYLELMEDAVLRVELVVGGLLNFSKKPKLSFSRVNLVDIIENVLLLTEFQFDKSNISVLKKYKNKAVYISGSANQLEQVILNIILNSIDAIDEKRVADKSFKGKITINFTPNHSRVILTIINNGEKIPEEYIHEIFDPFFTMKKIRQGTGLGLAVCYNIMEQHNSKISCKNLESDGVINSLEFPVYRVS